MEIFVGYVASVMIGISLGLIGGGGSIITIPVLVYLFHIEPTLATTYSLFIVGTTSLIGGVRSAFNKMVDFKSAILLAVPSTIGVYLTRHFVLPHVPSTILVVNDFSLTRDIALMLFFAVIMMIASVRMIRDKKIDEQNSVTQNHFFPILVGFVIGIVTGIIGAGGGFLIIPALVLLVGIPMKRAVGTSLIIIAINSLIGFVGDFSLLREINFPFLSALSVLAIAGVFLGTSLSLFIKAKNLKSGFGWFALAMAVFIVIKELMI